MALADTKTLVLGTVAFMVFWVLAVFPSFKLLPIGRTAGAVAGAVLTVVFQVLSPKEAYAAIDLSILGLLFGTMVVSAYLERADMFKYLGHALSWKSRGGKDLMCRVCLLSAICSALFTNDTSCVVLTEFVLKLCRQKNLHPKPFLIALATSANIGSVATPIGNPQNLVIAVQSGISFGKFLIGLLPSMLLGVLINTLLLLVVYWRRLAPAKDPQSGGESGLDSDGKIRINALYGDAEFVKSSTQTPAHEIGSNVSENHVSIVDSRSSKSLPAREGEKHAHVSTVDSRSSKSTPARVRELGTHVSILDSRYSKSTPARAGEKLASLEACSIQEAPNLQIVISEAQITERPNVQEDCIAVATSPLTALMKSPVSPVVDFTQSCLRSASLRSLYEEENPSVGRKWKRRAWKCSVYLVTAGMLAALLYGLDLSWSALTAAVVLMALDFQDAAPNLAKVSYSLLVFFAGMFITVEGFNTTGFPGTFWEAVEPHARIGNISGTVVLALVVIVLSNVASNVPTVLLLGSRVSASAALNGASVTRAWLLLAWTSTIAGNLTLVGSAANLIVSEQAGKAQLLGYDLTFWNHFVFGFPSTLIVAAVGLPTVRG